MSQSVMLERSSISLKQRLEEAYAARVRFVYHAAVQYYSQQPEGHCEYEHYKLVRREVTLSPHEHRRARQLAKCGSVQVVKLRAVPREVWPVHRSTVYVCVATCGDMLRLYVTHRRLKQVEEVEWNDLALPSNQDVLDELEFLLWPIILELRDRDMRPAR